MWDLDAREKRLKEGDFRTKWEKMVYVSMYVMEGPGRKEIAGNVAKAVDARRQNTGATTAGKEISLNNKEIPLGRPPSHPGGKESRKAPAIGWISSSRKTAEEKKKKTPKPPLKEK